MPATVRPLRAVLAAGVKEARRRLGLRQEDAAARARACGLSTWIRGTVAQAEVGARRFSLEELVLLTLAYETSLAELITGDEDDLVELAPGARLSAGALRALLSGDRPGLTGLGAGSVDVPATRGAPGRQPGRFPDVLAGAKRFGIGDRSVLEHAAGEVGDAERHAARRLGTTPERINIAAIALWGRTLAGERDHRLSEQAAGLPARSRQALRGHITRDLMAEIGAGLGDHLETKERQ